MRLTEIQNKTSKMAIPRKVYDELQYTEIDTVDEYSSEDKITLVDELHQGNFIGTVFKAPLSDKSKYYLLTSAIPNLIDIARDNLDKRLVNSLQKFQAKLNANLTGS